MGRLNYHELTIRKRPHFQPLEGTLFVTFRLADSIPKSTVRYYKAKRDWLKDQLRRVERISFIIGSLSTDLSRPCRSINEVRILFVFFDNERPAFACFAGFSVRRSLHLHRETRHVETLGRGVAYHEIDESDRLPQERFG